MGEQAGGILVSRENFKTVIEALRWIDEQYENVNMDHRHFRVGAKVKASDALEALFSAEPQLPASADAAKGEE